MTVQTISLSQLIPSKANVRRTGKNDSVDELVASIRATGLRQNLNVRATEDGRYEVVAGGRRLRALKKLAKEGAIAKDAPIPCRVLEEGEDAAEISLTENVVRVAMHPADQFEAFHALVHEKAMSIEEVATRFGVSPTLVEQRLKLASVAPKLLALYRKGDLTLAEIMAFAVSDDHEAQLRVWKDCQHTGRHPNTIRRALTEGSIAASDRLAVFVGLDAYRAEGGGIMRDLFDDTNSGYLTDRPLVLRLAAERLSSVLDPLRAEGWKWVKAELEQDYATSYRPVRGYGYADDEDSAEAYSADEMAMSGVRVRIGHEGELVITRGLIHPDDWQTEGRQVKPSKAKPDASKGELAASLVEDLSAHRTAALRIELARNPAVALAMTVHALALPLCYGAGTQGSCLTLRVTSETMERHAKVLGDSPAHQAMDTEAAGWAERLPEDADDLLAWCLAQTQDMLLELLAFTAALSVNAVQAKHERADSPRLAHADRLAEALALDMTQHWSPSVEGFYGRLPKTALIHVVSEAKAPISVSISQMKQKEAARYVARAVEGRGWLPSPLRGLAASQAA